MAPEIKVPLHVTYHASIFCVFKAKLSIQFRIYWEHRIVYFHSTVYCDQRRMYMQLREYWGYSTLRGNGSVCTWLGASGASNIVSLWAIYNASPLIKHVVNPQPQLSHTSGGHRRWPCSKTPHSEKLCRPQRISERGSCGLKSWWQIGWQRPVWVQQW